MPKFPSFLTAAAKTLMGASTTLGGQVALTAMVGGVAATGVFTAVTGHLPFVARHDHAAVGQNDVTVNDNGVTTIEGTESSPVNRLSIPVSGLVPGGSEQRAVDYKYQGAGSVTLLALNSKAQQSSLLDTDRSNGVQLRIDECSQPWAELADFSYSCSGQTRAIAGMQPIIGVDRVLSDVPFTHTEPRHYRFTVSLPTSAGTTMAGLNSIIQYDFVATHDGGQP